MVIKDLIDGGLESMTGIDLITAEELVAEISMIGNTLDLSKIHVLPFMIGQFTKRCMPNIR
ncbi:hypothetical protein PaeBR_06265 [Paenibacillus sp. BR2-3]